jgi:hypothetical protein
MKFGVSRFLPWNVENFKKNPANNILAPPPPCSVLDGGARGTWLGRMVSETNIVLKKPAMFQFSWAYDSGTARLPTTSIETHVESF